MTRARYHWLSSVNFAETRSPVLGLKEAGAAEVADRWWSEKSDMSFSSAATPIGQLLLFVPKNKGHTVRLENLDRESKWIVLLDRRDVDIEIFGRKSSSIVRLDLDFFSSVIGPQLASARDINRVRTFFLAFLASSSALASSRPNGSPSAENECTVAKPSRTSSTATLLPPRYIAPINPPCLSVESNAYVSDSGGT